MRNMYKNLKFLSVIFTVLACNVGAFGQGGVTTFTYSGGVQTYTVPRGVTKITVNALGAEGGLNSNETSFPDRPGYGSCVFDTLTVTVGQVINIYVGGQGATGTVTGTIAGGYNGGGNGANNVNSLGMQIGGTTAPFGGGGGGGASDVRVAGTALSNRVIVAGGGGGASARCATTSSPNADRGGDGGTTTGETGAACSGTTGGSGGTPTGGGTGGFCSTCDGLAGTSGGLGTGGAGGGVGTGGLGSDGGGGGGGLWGGGGGDWTGGGGGSNLGSSHAVMTRGCNSGGNGVVVIAPVCSTPGITGTTSICQGLTSTLADDTTGGTWSSSDGGTVITIGSSTGFVTGVAAGTTIVTYVVGPCYSTTVFTVNPLPVATTGADTVCIGLTTTLASTSGPGTWSSSNLAVGTVGSSSGTVAGITAGTALITYTLNGTGCINTTSVLVDPLPAPITGMDSVCVGLTTTYSDITATGSGAWSSSNPAVGTVDPVLGVITGLSAGTSIITYTIPTGACIATDTVKVNPLPSAVTGADTVCVGLTTLLSDVGGGTWSSGTTSVATIGTSSGIATGVHAGSSIITYTLHTTCIITDTIRVRPLPSAIFGSDSVCVGLTTTLTNDSTGGMWSSATSSYGTIDPILGVVTGITAGSTTITYTLPTSCISTTTFVVHPLPSAITGTTTVCSGLTTTLGDSPAGGTWSSSNSSVATVGSTGIVAGVTTGTVSATATITYTLGTGCIMTTSVLVNPLAPITGTSEICRFSTTTLSDFVTGGTWSSSNTAIGTVDPILGVVTGIAAGTTIITYELPVTNCASYLTVKVDSFSHITGTPSVCQGLTAQLFDHVTSGTWTSSNLSIATVNPVNGIVTGVNAGVDTITYTLPTGCAAYVTETVNPLTAIYGNNNVCVGFTTSLTDTTSVSGSGTWSSGSMSIALIGGSGDIGTVIGISAGTTIITYLMPTGCAAYDTVTVAPLTAITGTPSVCQGATINLSDATTGGTWSISSSIATINSTTGAVTGITPGTAAVSYTLGTGCAAGTTLTVNIIPTVPISGTDSVCAGLTTTLTDGVTGGTWSSSSSFVVVGGSSGIVFGINSGTTEGTAIITYTLPGNCTALDTIRVNPLPLAITGTKSVCSGLTTTLSDATPGGTWSSATPTTATIGSTSGTVTAVFTGSTTATTTIDYTLGTGCLTSVVVTVNPLPASISYATNTVCQGQSVTFTDATPFGTWSSGNTAVGTVLSSGIIGTITGVSAGTAEITYTISSTGCIATAEVVVDSLYPITGPASVCLGYTIALTDTASGGTWSSSTSGVGSISPSGVVTGVAVGITTITYSLPTGCQITKVITVNANPARPTATHALVCQGLLDTVSDVTTGGTWSSSNTVVATIGTSGITNGVISALSTGTTIITYTTTATGCWDTLSIDVYALASIVGPDSVCVGASVSLSDPVIGGTWQSSSSTIASVGSTGIVLGATSGTSIISYSLSTGCRATLPFTVNPLPFAISGPTVVCQNASITLIDVTGTGRWSSGDGGVGSITPVSGVLTGVSSGTAVITYTLITSCYSTEVVTVNPIPAPITGTFQICQFTSTTLNDMTTGGTWASTNTTVAPIGSGSGTVTGATAGTSVISYTLGTGCYVTQAVTVEPAPAITGTFTVCAGLTTTLSESIGGGTWSSSNSAIAAVGTSGIVSGFNTGVTALTATITYTFSTGCIATAAVTVNPLPDPITYTGDVVCQGLSIDYSDATMGGTWSSSNGGVAGVGGGTGVVTGTGGGTAIITYELATGCLTTQSVSVNPVTPITGTFAVCVGNSTTLDDATTGGSWISSNTGVATIGSSSGFVNGLTAGTSIITWLLPTGCSATATFTVNPPPNAITGPNVVCTGATIQLFDATAGGGWTSSDGFIASVSGGTVSGNFAGSATITYTLGTGCYSTYPVTVNPSPMAINGSASICVGTSTSLGDATSGGTWSSSNTVVATIGSTGLVNGLAFGTSNITYQLTSTGCYATRVETVNSLPSGITAATFSVCVGSTIDLSDATGGGTWSSSNTSIGTVISSGAGAGDVTGVGSGTTIITYTLGTACFATTTVTVLPQPSSFITPLSDTMLCPGGFVALTAPTGTSLVYQWYDGGSVISGATNSSYIDTVAGVYSVLVTQTITNCTSHSAGMNVTINPVTALITATGSDTACSGTGVLLIASDTTLTYQWLMDGTPISGATDTSYTATDSGSYAVVMTNSVGCSATSNAITAYINPSLPGVLTLSGPLTFCSGGSVTLTGDAGTGATYQWYTQSGTTSVAVSGATGVSFTSDTSGTFFLIETNTIGCHTVSANAVVDVKALPQDRVTASDTTTFCAGGSVTLSAPFSGFDTYQWYDDGVAIPGATGNSYFTDTTGSYQVMVDSNGCANMAGATDVALVKTPALVPLTPTSFCWGGSAYLSAVIVGGASYVSYVWYLNGSAIAGATTANYTARLQGEYAVAVNAPGSCFIQGDSVYITERPLPNPLVTYTVSVFHTQSYFVSYQWYLNGVAIGGANSDTLVATGNGTYKVAVTDTNGCQSISDNYILTDWTPNSKLGTGAVGANRAVNIYPNPAQTIVHVDAPEAVRAVITTIDGKTLIDQANATDINISSLADGMYMIMVYDGNGQMLKVEKLLKATN